MCSFSIPRWLKTALGTTSTIDRKLDELREVLQAEETANEEALKKKGRHGAHR
jgi:hypothetical protein